MSALIPSLGCIENRLVYDKQSSNKQLNSLYKVLFSPNFFCRVYTTDNFGNSCGMVTLKSD